MKRMIHVASILSLGACVADVDSTTSEPPVTATSQAVTGGAVEGDDMFGMAVAVGDFDGDSIDDLAVGAPYEAPGSGKATGSVFIYKGTANGLRLLNIINEADIHTAGVSIDDGDRFGFALAVVPSTAVGTPAQLIIGAPGGQSAGMPPASGVVYVLHGSPTGPVASNAKILGQSITPGTAGTSQLWDQFGSALAFKNGLLAVGVDNEDSSANTSNGTPNDGFGYINTFKVDANGNWTALAGLAAPSGHRHFGHSVAIADLNGDGKLDVIGGTFDSRSLDLWGIDNNFEAGGAVAIYPGNGSGFDSPIVLDDRGDAFTDMFGFSLATGKFDDRADGVAELAIGSPGVNPIGVHNLAAGRIYVAHFNSTWGRSWRSTTSLGSGFFGYGLAAGKLTSQSQSFDDLITNDFGQNQMIVMKGHNDVLAITSRNVPFPGISSLGPIVTDQWAVAPAVGRFTTTGSGFAQIVAGDWLQSVNGIPYQYSGSFTMWAQTTDDLYTVSRYWDEGMTQ